MSDQFTDEEIARLKELAKDLEAAGRVGRRVRAIGLWAAGIITSYIIVVEFFFKHVLGKG